MRRVLRALTTSLRRTPRGRILVAERLAGDAGFAGLELPLDLVPPTWAGPLDVVLRRGSGGEFRRIGLLIGPAAERPALLEVAFPAFANPAPELFELVVALDAASVAPADLLTAAGALARERKPIDLPTRGNLGRSQAGGATRKLVYDFGSYWRDQYGVHLAGWTHCGPHGIERLFLGGGGSEIELELSPRPDVIAHYPECGAAMPVGWKGYLAVEPGIELELRAQTAGGPAQARIVIPDRLRLPPPAEPVVSPVQRRFVRAVNEGRLAVLEIGARIVGPEAIDWRAEMHAARSYTGLDVHPSPQVDIVADAHRLTERIAPGSCEAIWSADVLEHLLMPWLVAAEINRALRPGGLTFHIAPQTWPVHEMPADYYRFSDVGLAALFGPAFGFEVIEAGMIGQMSIHPARRDGSFTEMPLFAGYGRAAVLSRKVAELPPSLGLEAAQRAIVGESGRAYPDTDRAQRSGKAPAPAR